ncbi:MAG: diaminopimelate decarboxylase [bacterium]|nr:diaminopimelate decarboxylase [bacterium]
MNSTNQSLKPLTTEINDNGHLVIGGCDLTELADKYGTPLYVLDEKTLRTICKEYKEAFSKYEKINFLYASKAMMNLSVAKIVASEGFGFDCVSDGELFTVKSAGVDMSKVLLNGNNKSVDELNMAIDYGVGHISVDNFFELSLLNELAAAKNKTVDVLLRITPGIECHTHEYIQTGHLDSKFGFDMTQIDEAISLICEQYKNLNLKGLHAHIGSQIFETNVYNDEIDILVKELARINEKYSLNLSELNIGGGIGVKYTEQDNPPSVFEFADVIVDSINKSVEKYGIEYPTIYIEPGRSIISTACVTLYTVGSSKQVPNATKYVAVNGGMADNPRPSLYQAEYSVQVANKADWTASEKVTVAGRYCESGDILVKDVKLPQVEEGDILCVFNTGAYNYSMSSNYNRVLKPAMVLVKNSQSAIIVKRETLEDLISHDVLTE